ncbi:MAG: alpha/beta fold hydrolase, partial [Rhodobacteraceae bacterium]|nr:alpha/beta fold hydrolase [Paracoccaceae bacterium]
LGIERWQVFGGSWGATLALVYAETHPGRVAHLVLRGVFLMTQDELAWFYGGGAGRFFPDQWQRFLAPLPEDERAEPIAAYHRRLFSGDLPTEIRHARTWAGWENALAAIGSDGYGGEGPPDHARAFARLENHYFTHAGFLDGDGWILAHAGRLSGIPGTIVQGRYDVICPPVSAWKLSQVWREASLRIVPLSGHALSEPGISAELLAEMDRLRGFRL